MFKQILILYMTIIVYCGGKCHESLIEGLQTTAVENLNKTLEIMGDINITNVMNFCNESFRTQMEYLKELNATGSFPDETDKTPMCFLRCYLKNVGVLSGDEEGLNKKRAVEMLWTTAEASINDCENEMKGNPCEKAYFLARCVITRALVDGRTNESDNQQ